MILHHLQQPPVWWRSLTRQAVREYGIVRALASCTLLPIACVVAIVFVEIVK